MLYHAVLILMLATGTVSAPNLQKFLTSAARNPQQLRTEEWQKSFHNQLLKAAFDKQKTPIEQHDFEIALDYFLSELVNMADRTRSSIETAVLGILHALNVGTVRSLISDTTNVSPDVMLEGKWVFVDCPSSEYGDSGLLMAGAWKYLTERRILRRECDESSGPIVIWVDEASQMTTQYDVHFLSQCRGYRGCLVYLAQALPQFYAALKGHGAKYKAESLMSNFTTVIIHACDPVTAEWAEKKIGRSLQTFIGGSMAPVEDLWAEMLGQQRVTTSTSEHYEAIVQANVFMNGLRCGGPASGFICDAVILRSGESFSSGQNFLRCEFNQK